MKKLQIFLMAIILLMSIKAIAQPFLYREKMLSINFGISNLANQTDDVKTWQGMPVTASFEYFFMNRKKLSLGLGFNAAYFRHQPGNIRNYGVLGLEVPINFHMCLAPRLDTYLGYKIGWGIDGYKPEENNESSGYNGLYSDAYFGVRYFILKRYACFTEISAANIKLSAGLSVKF